MAYNPFMQSPMAAPLNRLPMPPTLAPNNALAGMGRPPNGQFPLNPNPGGGVAYPGGGGPNPPAGTPGGGPIPIDGPESGAPGGGNGGGDWRQYLNGTTPLPITAGADGSYSFNGRSLPLSVDNGNVMWNGHQSPFLSYNNGSFYWAGPQGAQGADGFNRGNQSQHPMYDWRGGRGRAQFGAPVPTGATSTVGNSGF
jgi:hypothetical protein